MGRAPYSLQYSLRHESMTVSREYVRIAATYVRDKSALNAL